METKTLSNLIAKVKNESIDFDKIKRRRDTLIKNQNKDNVAKFPLIAAILVAVFISISQIFQNKKNMLAREEETSFLDVDALFEEMVLSENEDVH